MAADLHMLLMCGLKLNVWSNWISISSTEGRLLIFLSSITTFLSVWSPFFFIYYYYLKPFWIYYHLVFLITSESICKILISFQTFWAKAVNVLLSAKLYTNAINMKNNKPFIDRLNERGPSIEPWGTLAITFSNSQ